MCTVLLLSVAFILVNAYASMQSTIALEQEVRCGIEEHLHSEACYTGDILTCTVFEHTHDMNCYAVLLSDNDINTLLTEVENTEDRSLESVISSAEENKAEDSQAQQDTESVSNLLVLNENINTPPEEAEIDNSDTLSGSIDDIVMMAVGDQAESGNYNANFYVYIDGVWECIGTLEFELVYSSWRYTATVSTADMVSLINTSLGTNLTRRSFSVYYTTNAGATNYSSGTINESTTTFGSSSRNNSSARAARYVRIVSAGAGANDTNFAFYTVTLNHANGTVEKRYVQRGTQTQLPEGFVWTDANGNEYVGGDYVTVNQKTSFNATEDDGKFRIAYDVNFPEYINDITLPDSPTVNGELDYTQVIEQYGSASVLDVSERNVIARVTSSGHAQIRRIIHFVGWQIQGTDTVLQPNVTLDWAALQSYSTGSRISLVGLWEYDPLQTCTFYVKYDSQATTSGLAETYYTPTIFTSYVAGVDTNMSVDALTSAYGVNINAVSDEEVYEADKLVRTKYGAKEDEVYMTSFPEDSYIFEQLKQYADDLTVDGIKVSVDDLNENGYAIRWYVFKCQADSWHIDGKLVRKHGAITVTKTFIGNPTAVDFDKEGFVITAQGSESETEYLTLDNALDHDAVLDTYTWEVDDVAYGEQWTFTESQFEHSNYERYTEYVISDATGDQSGLGFGSTVTVSGMTYATDIGETEQLQVDFNNVYRALDSMTIKKEDSETGRALPGAEFEMYQNGELMAFTYEAERHTYYYDPNGAVTRLASDGNGFLEASIKNISFESGNIIVREITVPDGYSGSADIILGYSNGVLSIVNESSARLNDKVLAIPNTSKVTSVTVNKSWLCADYNRRDVVVQLLANDRPVNTLFPSVEASVVLNEANGYSYTWEDLAAYANGSEISWSVRETKIGDEVCRPDFTFPSWLVYYGIVQTDYDENGYVESVYIPVSNDVKRTVLRITKTDMSKKVTLSGAIFSIIKVDQNLEPIPDLTEVTLATDNSGTLIFENLDFGTYRITEVQAPSGYEKINSPIYITLNGDGSVTVFEHFYAEADSSGSFSVIIKNTEPIPIPETGGNGTIHFVIIFVMFTAIAVFIYSKSKMRINK